ncbi:MAG: hypothetical protein IPK98_03075 [Chloracidobacterium sp.]|nr:hypothetical protein [Chloracidobacterium sp.]
MKRSWLILITLLAFLTFLAVPAVWFSGAGETLRKIFDRNEPDLPPFAEKKRGYEKDEDGIDKEDYLIRRIENLDLLQGYDTAKQDSRVKAIQEMDNAEADLAKLRGESPAAAWTPLGPAPIPISASVAWSGRTSAIAVHPTNPNIVYVGTAQGGLYRTLNGGTTWTPLMDNAATLAIGAVAISPSDPTIVYVGTGESTQCGSGCFIGVGLYRINTADTTPVLTGPLNKDAANNDVFSGRAISEVLVHPTDPNTVFVATTSGVAGIGSSTTGLSLPTRGIYRTTNATAPNPTFALIPMGITERNVTDLVMDPSDPNKIWAGVITAVAGDGGVFATTNALAASPTWGQVLGNTFTVTGSQSRVELAAANVGGTTTVIAAVGEGTGQTIKSVGGGAFNFMLDNNFCNAQCFYDIAIAIDPTNANNVYLGGSPTLVFGRSSNGGTTYTSSSSGLHVDTQAITVAPSDPNTIYFGSDGGIWKSTNAGVNWTTLNNTTYSATQFMGLAVHPTETNYTLGGTQDNGTQYLVAADSTWVNSDGGDGGFAVIDQTSTSATSITAYHTYYNQTNNQIGFTRATTTVANGDPNWSGFLGCGGTANGIACTDATLFYAPMVGGPVASDSAAKNTLYFGSNKLYRSANIGTTMTVVSQALPGGNERVSAIGISPQNDAVRLIGSTLGKVYYSNTAGAVTMTDVTGTLPARYVGRIAFSPTDQNTAYVALNGYGIPGQHVMKTTNLNAPTPTWTNAGSGIPDVPTNALAIDPINANNIYAGTDIGVFVSYNGGTNWAPLGTGLPRVAVFGVAIQPTSRTLRIATHGRGMYQISIATPTTATVSGRILTAAGRGVRNATVTMTNSLGVVLQVRSGPFGNYRFDNVPTGVTYNMAVISRRFTFAPSVVVLSDNIADNNFIAQ